MIEASRLIARVHTDVVENGWQNHDSCMVLLDSPELQEELPVSDKLDTVAQLKEHKVDNGKVPANEERLL